jgi:2-keto-4-pentenoate hydratase/2-oxohepta-3-ene-1,7-dioic acid hydratase in catechol pathway
MKIATFSTGAAAKLGVIVSDGVVEIGRHIPQAPGSMIELIAAWEQHAASIRTLTDRSADWRLNDIQLLAPIRRPGKILGIGLNYKDHADEANMELPSEQLWFSKLATSVNDPFGNIQLPKVSVALDYEAELVFVVGQRIRHATSSQARASIFGYCCGNDVSVRDWQFKTSQFMLGKSFDSHAPFGPWIVTADALDAGNLGIRGLVNGELRQSSNTRHMIFDCCQQIVYLSQAMTLEPGDIIFTGTPSGVGAASKPPRWLVNGDVVRVEIDGLGAIENIVRHE